jgi:hypothetical protein
MGKSTSTPPGEAAYKLGGGFVVIGAHILAAAWYFSSRTIAVVAGLVISIGFLLGTCSVLQRGSEEAQ